MNTAAKRLPRTKLFVWLGLLGVLAAILGFAKTFFLPIASGVFQAPLVVHVHAVFLFIWVAFFLGQSLLIQGKNFRLHRRLGWLGAFLAACVVISTVAVGLFASRRTAASGDVGLANAELLVILLEMSAFAGLITGGILARARPEIHKRLMLLALIGSLGPAWFRFRHYFPAVDNPTFVFSVLLADSLIVAAAAADFFRYGRVHLIYPIVGGAMVGLHLIQVFMFESAAFRAIAHWVAGPLV